MRARAWFLPGALCWHFLVACGSGDRAPLSGDVPLAQVGAELITVAELERFVEGLPAWTESKQEGSARVRDYLHSLVDRELILQEARLRGLEFAAGTQAAVEAAQEERLVRQVEERQIRARVQIGEQEVERAFGERGWGRRLRIAHLVTSSRERAEEALRALRAGRSFSQVAAQYSEEVRSREHGGEMPYYYSRANATPYVRDALFALEVGQVSDPIPVPGGYEIFKVLDQLEVGLEQTRDKVYRELYRERFAALRQSYLDSLAERSGWQLVPEGMGELLDILRRGQEEKVFHLPESSAGRALFQYGGGVVSIGRAVELSASLRRGGGQGDSARVALILEREVASPQLLVLQARQLGIDREEPFVQWLERKREEVLIREMRRIEAAQKVAVSEGEVRAYYEQNRELYRTSSEVEVVEILVADEAEARALVEEVRAQRQKALALEEWLTAIGRGEKDFSWLRQKLGQVSGSGVADWLGRRLADEHREQEVLAEIARAPSPADLLDAYAMRHLATQRSLRPGDGLMHLHWYDRARYGELVQVAMEAPAGQIIGPIEIDSMYAIAKVMDHRKPEVLPFEEVAQRIAARLRQEQEERLFGIWLEEVRQARGKDLRYFDESIERLATTWAQQAGDEPAAPEEQAR